MSNNITESENNLLQIALIQAKAAYQFSQNNDDNLRIAIIYKSLEVLENCKNIRELDCFVAATEIFRQASQISKQMTDAYKQCAKFCDVVCIGKADEFSSEEGFLNKEVVSIF